MDRDQNSKTVPTRLEEKGNKKKDPVVYALDGPSRCDGCDRRLADNDIVKLENQKDERQAFCLSCAGLEDLAVLGKGNAALTRLSRKYSSRCFVIVKWSDAWKCYERYGLLVEKQALQQAQKEAALG
jgi:hypothetical protein